jgi:hypothetical protein
MKISEIQELVMRACEAQRNYISIGIDISRPQYSDNQGIDITVWHAGDGDHAHFRSIEGAVNHLRMLAGEPITNNEEICDG